MRTLCERETKCTLSFFVLQAAEKSETEDIEAAVVSVDLIKNKRPFKCQHNGCNKTFKNPQTMKMHHKTHYSDGSAASKECTLPSSLKAGHNKKIPSRCPKCKETFVGLYELRRHYGRKHSEGEKPFGCRKCDKKFYIEVTSKPHHNFTLPPPNSHPIPNLYHFQLLATYDGYACRWMCAITRSCAVSPSNANAASNSLLSAT